MSVNWTNKESVDWWVCWGKTVEPRISGLDDDYHSKPFGWANCKLFMGSLIDAKVTVIFKSFN
jgi:hypothetical protein